MATSSLALLRISVILISLGLTNCQLYKVHTPVESPATSTVGSPDAPKLPAQPGLDYSVVGQLLAMPAQYQRSVWQTRATDSSNEALQEQAIRNLSQRGDAAGISTFFQGLLNGKRRLRILSSRALMEIGPSLSTTARDSLMLMLPREQDDSAGALAWTLVLAQDTRVYDRALDLFRKRLFSNVQYFDGRPALDAALLGALNLPRTLSLARDSDPEVRRLVAATCSRAALPECAPWLVEFMKDVYPEVRIRAVPGLAKLGTRETLDTLNSALRLATGNWRNKYLESLRDEAGLLGLVAALHSVSDNTEIAASQILQIFELIDSHLATPRRSMLDPTGADAMADYMEHAPTAQWRYRAAQVLATMGDLRSLPVLVERLRFSPPQSKRDTTNATIEPSEEDFAASASLIADLADLHTESLGEIRKSTDAALVAGQLQLPVPRAEGMRALVKMDSRRGTDLIYKWARPTTALPAIRQYPPLAAQWLVAQAALRYVGRAHGAAARRLLEEDLQRRPRGVNVSGSVALSGEYAMLASAVNSLGIGAAQGLSEASNESSSDLLLRFALDPSENEQSRLEACRALAWTSNSVEAKHKILARARGMGRATGADNFSLNCLLETLSLTRTAFRNRLYQQALTGNHMAVDTLLLAGERGMLFALRDKPGDSSFAAYRAYFRFLPPAQILGRINPTETSGQPSEKRGN